MTIKTMINRRRGGRRRRREREREQEVDCIEKSKFQNGNESKMKN